MSTDWKNVRLDEVCRKIQDGAHHSPKKLFDGPGKGRFPYLTSKNIRTGYLKLDTIQFCDEEFHNTIFPRCDPELGDVLLTKDGANTGNVAINNFDQQFCLLSSVCLLKPDQQVLNSSYLFYYLQSPDGFKQITGQMTGAAIKRIILKTIKASKIPLPEIEEQKRIVAILDEVFAGIDTAIANTQKNLANARELFESFFNTLVDKKSKKWGTTTLGESCEFFNGKAHEKVIDDNGSVVVVNSKFISSEGAVRKKTKEALFPLTIDDITMVMSDVPKGKALAKCFIVNENNKFTLNQRICCIKSDKYITKFLYYQLNRHPYLLGFDNKENQTNLRKADILACPLFIPGKEEQNSIVETLDQVNEYCSRSQQLYSQKLNSLLEMKQSLLQKAFSGELTSNINEIMDEAVA